MDNTTQDLAEIRSLLAGFSHDLEELRGLLVLVLETVQRVGQLEAEVDALKSLLPFPTQEQAGEA